MVLAILESKREREEIVDEEVLNVGIFESAILNSEKLVCAQNFDKSKEILNVAFGIDCKFARGMGVLITSIILNNSNENMSFHVFTDGIDKQDIEKLKSFSQYDHVEITIYYINLEVFKKFPTSPGWSHATYYRFIMGETLYGSAAKMLYLDADVLCIGSLRELMEIDMGNNIILGIDDYLMDFEIKMSILSIKNGRYFNAGVMYIDIDKWHDEKIAKRAMRLISEDPKRYKSLDQDVLNVLLDGKTCFVDKKWDYIYNMSFMNHKLPENTVLIHYTGDKPWHSWMEHHFMVERYYEYMQKSPWSDIPLSDAVHYKEKRKMAKSYRKRAMYLESIKWYFQYLLTRVKTKSKI